MEQLEENDIYAHRRTAIRPYKSKLLSIVGAICLAAPVLFLENVWAAGIFCTLGLVLLLCGGRYAEGKSDVITNAALLWLGHSVRFCGLFGTEFVYTLYCALLFLPYCVLLAVALWLERLMRKSTCPSLSVASILVLPAAYALFSFLLAALNLGFVTNIMGYPMCIPVVAVNLSLFGEYGLTFLLMLLLLCLSVLLFEPRKKHKILYAAVGVLLTAFLLINGTALRGRYGKPDDTINVALATSQEMNFTGERGKFYTEDQQLAMFTQAVKDAAERGAKLLILNEEYFTWTEEHAADLSDSVSRIVRQYNLPTLIGVDLITQAGPDINEAVFFDADGEILYTYTKNNLVPFIEAGDYQDGAEAPALLQVTIDGHSVNLAYIICYDINDDDYLRTIPASTELLIVPSWDWDTENIEQTRTAVRSASLGVTMIKHSFDGFSTVSCPNGDCAARIDLRGCFETVTIVSVPIWEK